LAGFQANDKDKLPGRLQRRYVSKSRDAGPVNFIGRFGMDILTRIRFPIRVSQGARPSTPLRRGVATEGRPNHPGDLQSSRVA
jgi:hypothetical protein